MTNPMTSDDQRARLDEITRYATIAESACRMLRAVEGRLRSLMHWPIANEIASWLTMPDRDVPGLHAEVASLKAERDALLHVARQCPSCEFTYAHEIDGADLNAACRTIEGQLAHIAAVERKCTEQQDLADQRLYEISMREQELKAKIEMLEAQVTAIRQWRAEAVETLHRQARELEASMPIRAVIEAWDWKSIARDMDEGRSADHFAFKAVVAAILAREERVEVDVTDNADVTECAHE